jgi:hypothetical protein
VNEKVAGPRLELRLAFVSVAVFGGGTVAFSLWPQQRWIGYSLVGLGTFVGLRWVWDELTPFTTANRRWAACFVVVATILVAVWFLWPIEYGNLKQRTSDLAAGIQSGMRDRENTINEIQRSNPQGTLAQNFSPTQSLSAYFYGKYLKQLIETRDELARHQLRNQDLDNFIEYYQFEMKTRQREVGMGLKTGSFPLMNDYQVEKIVKDLNELAVQIKD